MGSFDDTEHVAGEPAQADKPAVEDAPADFPVEDDDAPPFEDLNEAEARKERQSGDTGAATEREMEMAREQAEAERARLRDHDD